MEPLEPEIATALARVEAHPLDPGAAAGVEVVQTHISHVFLTRERVYKLRKAVRLPFLDFSTRAQRDADCWRELHLNRRLAPDVYLGVAPIRRGPRGIEVGAARERAADVGSASTSLPVTEPSPAEAGADAEVLECCLVMRRLPEGRDALSLLQAGRLRAADLEAVAGVLTGFHAAHGLGVPAPFSPESWLERMRRPPEDCLEVLGDLELPAEDRERLRTVSQRHEERHLALISAFERRRSRGRAVDGHGDVHLQHVWFEADGAVPLLIDCIEFDHELRHIDVAAEVAFLAMDLAYRGRGDLAEAFLRAYARESDDFDLYAVVDYHVAYRALVRAKVAALAAADRGIDPAQRSGARGSASRHLALAGEVLGKPGMGRVVALCGSVGSGKSSVAARLAEATGGVVVASDRTRKRLAGLKATDRGGGVAGLYDEVHSDRVYRGLRERADAVLDSGRTVILDAAFLARARRREALDWARGRAAPAFLVEVRCDESVARARLATREAEDRDASDAGPSLLPWSRNAFEPPEEWPAAQRTVLDTDDESWPRRVPELARWLEKRSGSRRSGLAPFLQRPAQGGAR